MRNLENELETHTTSVVVAVRTNAEADQQRATQHFLKVMQQNVSSQISDIQNKHLDIRKQNLVNLLSL